MGTSLTELANSHITRIAGQGEDIGMDVVSLLGKGAACVSSVAIASNLITGAVSVTNTQVALRVGVSNLTNRQGLEIQNLGSLAIYVGPSGVTTNSGIKIDPNTSRFLALKDSFTLYGITASGTQNVRVMEMS